MTTVIMALCLLSLDIHFVYIVDVEDLSNQYNIICISLDITASPITHTIVVPWEIIYHIADQYD